MAKRKRNEKLLLITVREEQDKEITIEPERIRKEILHIFKSHIGEESFITPYELFVKIYGIDPYSVNVWLRSYYWDVIKRILMRMRSLNELFVINTGQKLYVLKEKVELQKFETKLDKHIELLNKQRHNARKWVKYQKWKSLI